MSSAKSRSSGSPVSSRLNFKFSCAHPRWSTLQTGVCHSMDCSMTILKVVIWSLLNTPFLKLPLFSLSSSSTPFTQPLRDNALECFAWFWQRHDTSIAVTIPEVSFLGENSNTPFLLVIHYVFFSLPLITVCSLLVEVSRSTCKASAGTSSGCAALPDYNA